jgi:hypothetical protein
MKCTARDIIDLHNALTVYGGLNLPAKTVLPFSRVQRAVRTEAEAIMEAQEKLVQQHQERDSEGKPVEIALPGGGTDRKIKDMVAYRADIKTLHAAEVEIPGEKFAADDLIRGEVNSTLVAALHFALKD